MAGIRVRGTVYYPPGPWGTNLPVVGATVKIVDVDLPGRGDDIIWEGSTDANGNFDGQSKDWQDTITTQIWVVDSVFPPPPRGHWAEQRIPDPSDIRSLVAKIEKDSYSLTLPFPYVTDSAPPIPLVLLPPISPPGSVVVANVNGVDISINNQTAIYEEIKNLVEAGVPEIKIQVYGPFASALEPILQSRDDLRRWVLERSGVPSNSSVLMPNPADWVIATGLICSAVVIIALGGPAALGGGFLIGCLGIALILAVVLGYEEIITEPCTRLNTPSGQIPIGFENCVAVKLKRTQSTTNRQVVAKVAFQCHDGKSYIVAEGGGGREVKADRSSIGLWETFEIEKSSAGELSHGDLINIKANSGHYLMAENGVLKAISNDPERNVATFMIERVDGLGQVNNGNPIALRTYNNQYVCAEGSGGQEVNANRDNRDIWETFKIVFQ